MWQEKFKQNFSQIVKGVVFFFPVYIISDLIIGFIVGRLFGLTPAGNPIIFGIIGACLAVGVLSIPFGDSADDSDVTDTVIFFRALIIAPIFGWMIYGDITFQPDNDPNILDIALLYIAPPSIEGIIEEGFSCIATTLYGIKAFVNVAKS